MTEKVNAMFPGSFNPIHAGHLDIIKRASKLFNKFYVVVSVNDYKPQTVSCKVRIAKAKKAIAKLNLKNVIVTGNRGLTVDFAKQHNISVIVRSIRDFKDAIYEMDMAKANHNLDHKIETILMLPKAELVNLSSTAIRYLKDAKKRK
ncbi:MAG: pantetheine-phosphate adenylyltransferase [Mycoplasmoidaceae bacterium]|nr:pantetheine-phosphate adenylyltransferase [Mycoplasmoidaceae bacterium]